MGHTLLLLPSSPYPCNSFICNLCREQGCGPVYHCPDCDFDLHVACAALSNQHTHFAHPHHLLHRTHRGSQSRKCDSCGSGIRSWSFRCEPCDFDMHSVCAQAPRFIPHPRHSHPLELLKSPSAAGSIHCSGCRRIVSDQYYSCRSCCFHLHQACATLPSKIKHVKHQAHMLTVVYSLPQHRVRATCRDCKGLIEGWYFNCATCNFNLHPVCADIVHELPHSSTAAQESNIGTTLANTQAARNVVHSVPAKTISHACSHVDVPNSLDFDAVKKVLRFAEEMMKANGPPDMAESSSLGQQGGPADHCPTCLEGFEPTNPRKVTSCGHSFHMACIMEWMERSNECPICRGHLATVR